MMHDLIAIVIGYLLPKSCRISSQIFLLRDNAAYNMNFGGLGW